jgi:aspartyl-tRNA(Asn)/glutamyl-tRNA(Gln) amidotransferase subunit C
MLVFSSQLNYGLIPHSRFKNLETVVLNSWSNGDLARRSQACCEARSLEVMSLQTELNALLGHFGDIQSLSLQELEPILHASNLTNVWAEDISMPSLRRESALKNAPISKAGLFLVPMIIED